MNAKTLILAILNFQEASGYEIRKRSTEGPFSYFVDISFGSIYPTLAKLEADGLIAGRSEQQDGKPDRKLYSLTERGRAEFVKSLREPPQQDQYKSEFLLISMLAELGTRESLERAITDRVTHLKSEMSAIRGHLAECDRASTRWVAEFGLHCMQADLDYVEQNKDKLLALAGNRTALPDAVE